ncbi:glycosyltransferase family 2 protein [Salinibacterium soli]|uniref:Glycosyltransferase n=1 Tax=Antiquaquibacter soli TaxID=3064523 RepID=A0ABT9BJC7_9MICO|nr:glycosyltransferase [Protaetiibacter sp. WY-16]MDO7881134.1 glycosyltransferase [Protaetiibacter sp. WY-16]
MTAALDIMMPFYGDVGLFVLAVESVRRQEGDWRLVVIDDRYPDPEPARYIAALDDPRIEYVLNDENLGISGNFQRAIDLASAPYTVIMGCDDIMLPGFVSRVLALAERFPDAAYLQPRVRTIDSAGAPAVGLTDRIKSILEPRGERPLVLSGEELATSLLRGNWTYFPSLCWKTEVLREHGFDPGYDIVLDLALQIDIIVGGGSLVLDGELVFEYRRHRASASSWTSSDNKRFIEERRFFLETADRLDRLGWRRAARTSRAHVLSRLNAGIRAPGALVRRDWRGVSSLGKHLFSRR